MNYSLEVLYFDLYFDFWSFVFKIANFNFFLNRMGDFIAKSSR